MFISKIKCFYYFPIGGHDQDTYLTFICIYKTGTWCLKSILAIIQWGSRQGYGSNCFIGQKKIVLLRNAVTHGFNAKLSQLMSNKDDKVKQVLLPPPQYSIGIMLHLNSVRRRWMGLKYTPTCFRASPDSCKIFCLFGAIIIHPRHCLSKLSRMDINWFTY